MSTLVQRGTRTVRRVPGGSLQSVLAAAALVAAALLAAGPAGASGGSGSGSGGGGGGGSSTSTTNYDGALDGEILVKLRRTDALPALQSRYGFTVIGQFGSRPIYRLKVTASAYKSVFNGLSGEADVMIAEANNRAASPEARRNMPWVIGNPDAYVAQWAPQALRLPQAQAYGTGVGVRVAVLDTGFDLAHPALAGRWLPGFDFVDYDTDPSEVAPVTSGGWGHGTHVAGLIAMVAPGARVMPLRVLDNDGVGNAWVLGEALLYALNPDGNPDTDDGAHVINLSLGSLTRTRIIATLAHLARCGDSIPDDPVADLSDPGYNIDRARCATARRGALVVAAAGNDGSGSVKTYPAAEGAYGLMPVAADTAASRLATFTNSGNWITLAAPGEGLTSTLPGGGYGTWSGTSMAAPIASGVAALVQGRDFSLAPRDVQRRLERSAGALCGTNSILRLDALAAVTGATAPAPSCR